MPGRPRATTHLARGVWHIGCVNQIVAKLVQEIMNREVFSLRPEESAEEALNWILALRITGAPVVDRNQRWLGTRRSVTC